MAPKRPDVRVDDEPEKRASSPAVTKAAGNGGTTTPAGVVPATGSDETLAEPSGDCEQNGPLVARLRSLAGR
ncbi:hypothetical protein [Natronobacterium gregoryi]|uniref:Uncharacterized protein n=2 Tax=Natronobacterium gregoryi TaxID=44930 RepID=L0AKS2_NATGS|nr:hypothetical protein [Natronobacterium gregoryi]AFZ74406.1 hypothetical protein Natgr_3280 [Natronobacterium gregoryi SP2]ELY72134.1 hypothetical protein C490_04242 [Natronobacterium gregoryi SP2]PLK19736.1 hypothetical protein CYV19_13085 [Natronobacterium gregoryi SP2]SFJ40348.1 hypothetical protein SAMN05443661_1277 [Natronobacterium gregoryi]